MSKYSPELYLFFSVLVFNDNESKITYAAVNLFIQI
ncbi:small protein involved in the cell envelope stress response [Escherichia coli]|nr:small protein involved in the cell envelope stress response [Escherichia coli]